MKLKEYLDMVEGMTRYYTNEHKDIEHFKDDMKTRGIPIDMMKYYFPIVVFIKTGECYEIYQLNDGKEVLYSCICGGFGKDIGNSILIGYVV